jgi:beta-lactamase class A
VNRAAFARALAALALLPQTARASTYERIESIARTMPGVLGVCCRTLGDAPPLFEYNAETVFPTASTIKVLIMATAYVADERAPGALDDIVVTRRADLIGGSDFMSLQPDGARLSVRQLIVPMIQLSDNTASNALISHFGFGAINATARSVGMPKTRLARHFLDYRAIVEHNDNVSTPSDMAALLYAIARSAHEGTPSIVSSDACRAMVRVMLGQTDRDKIPEGLPRTVAVANKTGEIDGSRNDVAIVSPFGESPYVLTVYTKWLTDYAPAFAAIHRIARLSYRLAGS